MNIKLVQDEASNKIIFQLLKINHKNKYAIVSMVTGLKKPTILEWLY